MPNIQTTCAFLLIGGYALVAAASMSSRREVLPEPFCPTLEMTADASIWDDDGNNQVTQDFDFFLIMNGLADMRPLSQFIVDQGTDFEEYMLDRVGNFQVLNSTSGDIDPWSSVLWKLNALTGPILASPYQINRTDENADMWDAWWNALQDLSPSDTSQAYCDPNAQDSSFKPWAVGFPQNQAFIVLEAIMGAVQCVPIIGPSVNSAYSQQPVDYLLTRVWDIQTSETQSAPDTHVESNGDALCLSFNADYSKSVTESTTVSSQQSVSSTTSVSTEVDVSDKAGISLGGLTDEISTTIKDSLSTTVTEALTTGVSETKTVTETVTFASTPTVLPEAVVNITVWTQQTIADIYITGDVVYDAEKTGIQTWIQGNGIPNLANITVPELILESQLATPGQIRDVAKMAMILIGAEWSDTFLDTLISPSVAGRANSVAGKVAAAEIWTCDLNSVPELMCDQTLHESFPPQFLSCPSKRRTTEDPLELFESESHILSLLDYDDCYTLEPADGYKNRWYIHPVDNCTATPHASSQISDEMN
eukprot:Clim_evm45s99 gene=Clim_evmTU45s99